MIRWHCRDRVLELGARTAVMGVLNVTPDSFSDGGRFFDPARAVEQGLRMREDGADLLDIGGESTRPGAEPVPAEEELRRVLPVVSELARRTDALISVDTSKAEVAEKALLAGAHIVNDVTAMRGDPLMMEAVKKYGAGVVLMHMQGDPATMQKAPRYRDVVREVGAFLQERLRAARDAGIEAERIALDPGIGFGKTVEHNLALLAGLNRLGADGYPLLVGVSRKSLIGHLLGRGVDERRAGSLGLMAYAILRGAHVVRVHDVKESCDVARLVDMLRAEEARRDAMGET